MRAVLLFAAFAATCLTAASALFACGGDDSTTSQGGGGDGGGAPPGEAGAKSTCEVTRAYVTSCKGDLNCGPDKYDAWCAANDVAINSDAYRRAEQKCLVPGTCDPDARRRCEYGHYATETATDAQKQVVQAYCETCEPADVAGCATRSVTYDPAAGPEAVTDIFIAAWELSDPLCDEVRAKCTGAALDAGADCVKSFAACAGGVYLDNVPSCP